MRRCLALASWLCGVLALTALGQEVPWFSQVRFAAPGPNDQKVQVLGDRFDYWADDADGQFYGQLAPPALAEGAPWPVLALRLILSSADGVEVARQEAAGATGVRFLGLLRTSALAPGSYVLSAELVDEAGQPVAPPPAPSFAFTRSDRRQALPDWPAAGIPLVVEPQSALPNGVWPVRVGVPLPPVAVPDLTRLQVTRHGQPVPANLNARATWGPTGTVKWVHVDFNAQYQAGQALGYALQRLPEAAAPVASPLRVSETAETITVDTGALRFTVKRQGFAGIEQAWLDSSGQGRYNPASPLLDGPGGPYLIDDRRIRFAASLDPDARVIVEEAGPARVTLLVEGWYGTSAGVAPIYRFKTRIKAFAGEPFVRISQHTIIASDTRAYRIAELGFELRTPTGTRYALGADGAVLTGDLPKAPASVSLHQDRADHFRLLGLPAAQEGQRGDGWFSHQGPAGEVSVVLRDLWQKFPKQVALNQDGLSVYFWPRNGHRAFALDEELAITNIYKFWCWHQGPVLDLHLPGDYLGRLIAYGERECKPEHALGNGEGLAIANEFAVRFTAHRELADDAATAQWAALFLRDPAAAPPPAWNASTLAMGPIAAADPTGPFAQVDQNFTKGILGHARTMEQGNGYGMWNYADVHTYWKVATHSAGLHRTWLASHYHNVGNTWMMYFTSGNPELLRWARANTDHFTNVDTVNWASTRFSEQRQRTEPTYQHHVAGAMYHCKAPNHWGCRDYGMNQTDLDIGVWGHFVDADAALWAWYIGGEEHARDVYGLWSAAIQRRGAYLRGTKREINTSLAMALTYYQASWDGTILPAIHGMGLSLRTEEPLEKQLPGPLWHPLWVNRYYHQTRDPAYREFILKYGKIIHLADTWNLALAALAYELTEDASYLTPHTSRLAELGRSLFHAPGDLYDGYGRGPGPLGFRWGEMSWPEFHRQLQRAKISDLPPLYTPSVGFYPCAYPSRVVDASGKPGRATQASATVYILKEADQAFDLAGSVVSLSGGNLQPASLQLKAPSGKMAYAEPKLPTSNWRAGFKTQVPADGETGLYELAVRCPEAAIGQNLTPLPELAILPPGRGLRARATRGYAQPWGPPAVLRVTISAQMNQRAGDDLGPVNFVVSDATGKVAASGSLLATRPAASTTFTLDPAQHPLPWLFDIAGVFDLQFRGDTHGLLFASKAEHLAAIAPKLPAPPALPPPAPLTTPDAPPATEPPGEAPAAMP